MTSTAPTYQRPVVFRSERLERLVLNPASIDWAAVETMVQGMLEQVRDQVALRGAAVPSHANSNNTPRAPLFAYRTFEAGAGFDPIVAGLTFKRTDHGITVVGAFAGEESGKIYFESQLEVGETSKGVREAAEKVGAALLANVDALVEGLNAPEQLEP